MKYSDQTPEALLEYAKKTIKLARRRALSGEFPGGLEALYANPAFRLVNDLRVKLEVELRLKQLIQMRQSEVIEW